ncbi:HlyD family type I secretion periplasmic adaptor subunit [Roseibium sp.]|uniref:HlyD family type I secretion periplasmic adaptor subunit n=1 Tax=Roseibium sp. TaxID=1936156 RepID=UPI003296FE27
MSTSATQVRFTQRKHRRWSKQTRYLSQSLLLEEVGPPQALRSAVVLVAVSLFAFLGWAYASPLAERVSAVGQVVPNGSVLAVQHLEGGIVSAIPAKEGEIVEPGNVLVVLDPISATADHEEKTTRIAALKLRAERLRAFAEGRLPAFTSVVPDPVFAGLIADQNQIYEFQVRNRENELQVLIHAIEQRQSELLSLQGEKATIADELGIVTQVTEMRKTLLDKGLISRVVYLGTLQQQVTLQGQARKNTSETIRVQQAIAEARGKLVQLASSLESAALAEMGEVSAEIARLERQASKSEGAVSRLEIRAPVRGIVKSVVPNTIGGIIPPGSLVAEIVPLEEELIVEVQIAPEDVGQLRQGQVASVKVSAYDFYRHGEIDGILDRISPSTFENDDGSLYYKARIRLNKLHVGESETQNLILPGMTVEVDVQTGSRTVLQYLLKPLYASVDQGFSER